METESTGKRPRKPNSVPRKRSPRPLVNNGERKHSKASEHFKRLWADPEWRAMMMVKRKASGAKRAGNPLKFRLGVPDGMRKKDADVLWAQAAEQAKRFITLMEDFGEVEKTPIPGSEAEMAKAALEEAFRMSVSPLTDSKTKGTYLRMVLDFTKAKPESKSKLTLDKSEEWLAALAEDMNNGRPE